ncbi:hypothetical protein PIB30_114844, partial [Stylosanthes scabra]|nr:hypothetical protein [Stylosanthes scabra]
PVVASNSWGIMQGPAERTVEHVETRQKRLNGDGGGEHRRRSKGVADEDGQSTSKPPKDQGLLKSCPWEAKRRMKELSYPRKKGRSWGRVKATDPARKRRRSRGRDRRSKAPQQGR